MPELTNLDDLEQTSHAEVFDNGLPRTVRLRLEPDQRFPAHNHPGTSIVFHLLTGELDLSLDDEIYSLESGDIIRFSGERAISPHAITESTAVLVFAPVEG